MMKTLQKHKLHRAAVLVIAALCLILPGCNDSSDVLYSRFMAVSPEGWNRLEYLEFLFSDTVEFADKGKKCDVLLVVRHSEEYDYSSLWLAVETPKEGGDVCTDSVEIVLADEEGKWLGKGQGRLYEKADTICSDTILPIDYMISICHAMRDENLKGINDVGVIIKESK